MLDWTTSEIAGHCLWSWVSFRVADYSGLIWRALGQIELLKL